MSNGEQRAGVPDAARDGELDLSSVGKALLRKKWWVLGPTIAITLLTFVGVNLVTPRYKSEARILLEGRESVFLRPLADNAAGDRDRTVDQEAVTSQVQLALSRDVARQVIKTMKLGEKPEFDPALNGVSLMRYSLGFLGLAKDPLRMTAEERVLEAYYERLTVFQVDKSRVISIEFQSADPELAARVANTVADTYIAFQQTARLEQTRAASQWLSGEIDRLRKRVAEADAKVEEFRSTTNLFVGTNGTTLSSQTLGESNRDLAAARSQQAEIEAKARFIRDQLKKGVPIEASDVANSDLIRRLSEQRATLRAQLAEQSSTLLDNHPRIKELKAQIAEADRQIRGEAERLARAFENDAQIASARVDSLSKGLDQLKRQAAVSNDQDVQLRALQLNASADRDLLASYLAKYNDASARDSLGAVPGDARIVSRAVVSNTPYFPKKLPIVLIATLATLFVTAGFITTGELLSGNVYRSGVVIEPVMDRGGWLPLPSAPGPHATITHHAASESVPDVPPEQLSLADIAQALREAGDAGKRVALVGATPNVGTTVTAIALARMLARDARVVLVDLSLERPNLAAITTDPGAPGVAELVRGSATFAQIITRDRASRVQVIPAGKPGPDSAAIVISERLAIAIDALARTYDHLVIDAGAVPGMAAERISRFAPCAVLVASGVPVEEANAARDHLSHEGFEDVAIFAGTPPDLASQDTHGVAA
jgi:polysaccharide biosynthesis transport protein